MNQIEYNLTELHRRLANIVRMGTIQSVDLAREMPMERVRIGQLTTSWLPFMTLRASNDKTWWPIQLDEQVLVLSPSGELAQGVVLGALYQQKFAPASQSADIVQTDFSDGAVVRYDKADHHLQILLPDGGKVTLISKAGVKIEGDVDVDGNIKASKDISDHTRSMQADRDIYNQHKHKGVMSGQSETPPPTQQQ